MSIRAATLLFTMFMAADFPLQTSRLVTGPNSRVTLTNAGSQPVTAWSLETTTPREGGFHHEVETVDGYLSEATQGLAGSSPRLDRLMPGESREITLDPLPSDATVRISAVVLDDGTAIGDEEVVKGIFQRRAQEREALGAVTEAFDTVLQSARGTAALDMLRSRLATLVQRNPAVPCRAALDAVETFQHKAAAGNTDQLDQSLQMYAAFVKREYELAVKHSQRKGL